jgi:hypothetical protein
MSKSAIDDYKIPEEFICSMSQRIMIDPVTISNGSTFDRSSITQMHRQGWSTPICSKTGVPFDMSKLVPNRNLKDAIEYEIKYLEKSIEFLSRYNLDMYMCYIEQKAKQNQDCIIHEYKQTKLEQKKLMLKEHKPLYTWDDELKKSRYETEHEMIKRIQFDPINQKQVECKIYEQLLCR